MSNVNQVVFLTVDGIDRIFRLTRSTSGVSSTFDVGVGNLGLGID